MFPRRSRKGFGGTDSAEAADSLATATAYEGQRSGQVVRQPSPRWRLPARSGTPRTPPHATLRQNAAGPLAPPENADICGESGPDYAGYTGLEAFGHPARSGLICRSVITLCCAVIWRTIYVLSSVRRKLV